MLVQQPAPIQPLTHPLLTEKGIQADVLRLDKVHEAVSGNKFFKLLYNLEEAKKMGKSTLLTFGGAFSNHIYATASAAHQEGFNSIGLIRGEDADLENPTLLHAKRMGMDLHLLDRSSYRSKNSPDFLDKLQARFGDFYLIPEGGTNENAIQGTKEILNDTHSEFSHFCVSIGTGGTLAGLAATLKSHQTLLGFSSLKGDFISKEIENLLSKYCISPAGKLEIRTEFHFGGYGKVRTELIEFIFWFYEEFKVPLDPIYTGKMAFGVWDLIQANHFPPGSKILLIHTGGLQGNAGFEEKTGIKLPTL